MSLDITREFHEEVVQLMIETEATSMTEVMRRAAKLLRFVLDEQKAGRTMIARDDEGYETRVVVL